MIAIKCKRQKINKKEVQLLESFSNIIIFIGFSCVFYSLSIEFLLTRIYQNDFTQIVIIFLLKIMKKIIFIIALIFLLFMKSSHSSCPQLCQACNGNSCTACYSAFQDSANVYLTSSCSCPNGYFLQPTQNVCNFCPIYCTSCTNYTFCSSCIKGYEINNKNICVQSRQNTNHWITNQISYDLTNDNLANSLVSGFLFVNATSSASINTYFQFCQGMKYQQFFGLYSFGANTELFRSYFGLPYHQWAQIRFQFVAADNWNQNSLILEINGQDSYVLNSMENISSQFNLSYTSSGKLLSFCLASYPDNLGIMDASFSHLESMIKIRIKTSLDGVNPPPDNANFTFFGIRQVLLRVGTCPRFCSSCTGPKSCTSCQYPTYLGAYGSCLCNPNISYTTSYGCHQFCKDGFIYLTSLETCSLCSGLISNCHSCVSQFQCSICHEGYFLFNGLCFSSCPQAFQPALTQIIGTNHSKWICSPCPGQCISCQNQLCQNCAVGFYYFQGQCLTVCPAGYFIDYSQTQCLACPQNCLTCQSFSKCLTCVPNSSLSLLGGKCVLQCSQTICQTSNCSANCLNCSSNGDKCYQCSTSTLFQNFQCVTNCSVGFYQVQNRCKSCIHPCLNCRNDIACITCHPGYANYLGVCHRKCPNNFYVDSNSICQKCPVNCTSCYDFNSCFSCLPNFILENGKCLRNLNCGLNMYFDERFNYCQSCSLNCTSCYRDQCYSCTIESVLDNGECRQQCGVQKILKFRNITLENSISYQIKVCQWKDPLCKTYEIINSTYQRCTQCIYMNPKLVLLQNSDGFTQCSFICPVTQVKALVNQSVICLSCPQYCLQCNSVLNCLMCDTMHVINPLYASGTNSQQCISNCPTGFMSDGFQCVACIYKCATCQLDGKCLTCVSGYVLLSSNVCAQNNSCNGYQYYNTSSNLCNNCSAYGGCNTCNARYYCSSCITSNGTLQFLQGYYCGTSCNVGYFQHMMSLQCRPCSKTCSQCIGFEQCTSCVNDYYLLPNPLQFVKGKIVGVCVQNCPSGYFNYNPINPNINISSCQFCSSNCLTCYGQLSSQCLTCYGTFKLDHSTCTEFCPSNKYADQYGHCDWCDPSCLECTGPAQFQCISCANGSYLYRGQCWTPCPAATFPANYDNRICQDCQWGCAVCSSPYYCYLCFGGFYLYEGWCYSECPYNTHPVRQGLGMACSSCKNVWNGCNKCSNDGCLSCQGQLYLYKAGMWNSTLNGYSYCMNACPVGYFKSLTNLRQCLACQSVCTSCTSLSHCTSCASGYILNINGLCTINCPLGLFYNGNICVSCPINCRICSSANACSQCQNGYYLFIPSSNVSSLCRTSCPNGYYADDSGICLNCFTNCVSCKSQFNCTTCSASTTLSNGVCIYTTPQNCNDSHCAHCLSSTTCQFCMIPFYLYQNSTNLTTCIINCPNGFYEFGRNCKKCNLTCITCQQNLNNCSSCISGLYLFDNQCFNYCPIGFYSNSTTSKCQQCLQGCYQCKGLLQCLQCSPNYYLYQNNCYINCPVSTYPSGLSCLNCGDHCQNCFQKSLCTVCQEGFYLLNNSCIYICPTNYYLSSQTQSCLSCQYPCEVCLSQTICTSCIVGFVLTNNECQQSCQSNYYQAINTDESQYCKKCSAQCKNCTNQNMCTSCADNFYLIDGNCNINCPITTYPLNGICIRCSQYCLQCNQYSCQLCNNSTILYNNTCVTICPQGTFSTVSVSSSTSRTFSLATNVCDNCSSLCLTCNGSSAYECLSCNNNYYLYNSTCLLVCPQGFFASIIDQTCKKCMFGCAVCTNFSQCQQCNTNFTLSSTSVCINTIVCSVNQCQICSTNNSCAQCILPYNLYFNSSGNSSCVLTCPLMTYQSNQFICVPCSSNCISCTNVNCLNCSSNYYLYQGNCVSQCPIGFQAQNSSKKCLPSPCLYSNSNGSCVQCVSPYLLQQGKCRTSCDDGYYAGVVECLPCSSQCQQCDNFQICKKCNQHSFNLNGECLSTCPSGYYQYQSDQQLKCKKCQIPNCFDCSNSTTCVQCQLPTFLSNGSCVYNCPTLYYYLDQITNNCQSCQSNCIQCTNATACYLCSNTTALFQGNCLSNCPNTYYMITSNTSQLSTFNIVIKNNQCVPCILGCQQCINNFTCNQCTNQFNLYQTSNNTSICVNVCPSGFYSTINQICAQCPSNCLTCDYLKCYSCSSSTNLFNGMCINTCPSGFYSLNSQCLACNSKCATCIQSGNNCLSCIGSLILDGNGNCVQNCTSNTQYYDNITKSCKNCSSDCMSCSGPSYDDCTTCHAPLVLFQQICVVNCPAGLYPNQDLICTACQSQCQTCDSNANDCSSCSATTVLVVQNGIGKCVTSCPSGMFYNTQQQICQYCSQNCLSCSSSNQCTTCNSNFALYLGECISYCPQGYALVNNQNSNVCQLCPQGCLNCTSSLNTFICTECYQGLHLYQETCFLNCPSNTFLNSNNQCQTCLSPCSTCSSLTNCLSCLTPYLLYNGNCLSSCPSNYVAVNKICILQPSCAGYIWNNTCVSICPSGTYSISVNGINSCQSCTTYCLSCVSNTSCSNCASGTFLLSVNTSTVSSVNQNSSTCVISCPLTTYVDNSQCLTCPSPCSQCSLNNGQILCVTCLSGYYLLNGKCLTTCPSGYYQSTLTQSCVMCMSSCLTCNNSTGCLTCANSAYSAPSCSGNCSAGFYWSLTSNSCVSCYTTCATCYGGSSSQCNTCKNISGVAYYLYGGQCLTVCPTGYYASGLVCYQCTVANCQTCFNNSSVANCSNCSSGYILVYSPTTHNSICTNTCQQLNNSTTTYIMVNNTCISCQTISNCLTCTTTQNNNLSCVQCTTGFYLYMGTCYSVCPSTTYQASPNCYNCQSKCLSCSDSTTCTLCTATYFLFNNNCVQTCPDGTYTSNQQCINCPIRCNTCNSTQCVNCQSPYALDLTNSCTLCQSGYYMNSSSNTCLICSSNCLQCSVTGSNCTKCPPLTYILNNKCYLQCPLNYQTAYVNNVSTCTQCSLVTQNCATCASNNCTSCTSNTYSYINPINNSLTCVALCPSGTFVDTTTQSCKYCLTLFANCPVCNSQSCNQCAPNYYLLLNVCYSTCPMGYFANSVNGTCDPCNIGCKSCLSLTNCLICSNNLVNDGNGTCSQKPNNCTLGWYLNSFNICSTCDFSCLTCSGPSKTDCLSCQAPQFSLQTDGTCKPQCIVGQFYNTTSNSCQDCSVKFTNCSSCNSSNCLTCSQGILSNGQCISGCANGTYLYNQQCLNCPQYCANCNSSTFCSNCSSSATIYYNNLCYTICPSGSYSSGSNTCSACISPCLTCSITGTNCSSCMNSYYYYNFMCVTNCPNGTFVSGNTCTLCSPNCLSCNSIQICTNCSTNYVLYNGVCNNNCPSGYYANSSKICVICPIGCATCLSATNCQSCTSGYAFISANNSCQNSCGDGKFLYTNTTSNITSCINCQVVGCVSCNSTTCFKCNSSLYSTASNNVITNCTSTCPPSYYKNVTSMTCINCLTNCYQCSNQNNCTQCNSGYVLFNSTQCLLNCPVTYFSVTINNIPQCQSCSSNCNYCTNSTVCTDCASPTVLLNNQCVSSCPSGNYLESSTNKCMNCTVLNCGNCSSLTCYKCKSNYYGILDTWTQQISNCTTTCPTAYYADSVSQNCLSCLLNCISCTNSSRCLNCSSSTVLYSNSTFDQCLNQCPNYFYQSSTYPKKCLACGTHCQICQNSTICYKCDSGYSIFYSNSDQICVQTCPHYYYSLNSSASINPYCAPCEDNCISCTDNSTCIECENPSAYTLIGSKCIPHNCVNCQDCDNSTNPPICTNCVNPYFLYHNLCIDYCPDYHYQNNASTYYQCSKCIDNCVICTDNISCTQCIPNYVYVNTTGCVDEAVLLYGNLANMSSFTSNITQTVATVYLSSSAGPMVFGQMSNTYFNIQFTQFLFFHEGATGGNPEMSNFLNSLQVMSLTNGGTSSTNTTDPTEPPANRRRRLQQQYTSSFIQVNAPIFAMMFGFLGFYLFIIAFQKYLQDSCRSNCSRAFLYIDQICTFMQKRFKWIYFDFIMWISYLPFLYFSLLQLKNISFSNFAQGFSSLLAIVIIVAYPLYPVFIIYLLKKDYFKLAYDTDLYREGPPNTLTQMSLRPYVQKVKRPIHMIDEDLVEEQNLPSIKYFTMDNFRLIYNPLKYLRKFIFVLIVVAVSDPITLVSILIGLNVLFIIYMFALRPRIMPYLAFDFVIEFVLLFFEVFLLTYLMLNGASISIMSIIAHGIGFLTANISLVIAIVLNLIAYYKIFQCIKDLIVHLKTKVDEADKKQILKQKQLKEDSSSIQGIKEGELNLNDKQLDNGKRKKFNDDSLTQEDDESIRLSSNGKELARDLDEKQLVFNGIDPVQYAKQFSNIDDDMPNLKLSQGKIKDKKKGSAVNQMSSEESQMGNSKVSLDDDQLYLVKDINKKKKQDDKYKKSNAKTKVQDVIVVEQTGDKFKKNRRSKKIQNQLILSPMQDSEVNLNINTHERFKNNSVQQQIEDVKINDIKKRGKLDKQKEVNEINTYDKNSNKHVSDIKQTKTYEKAKNSRQVDLNKLENQNLGELNSYERNKNKKQESNNDNEFSSIGKVINRNTGEDLQTLELKKNKISKQNNKQSTNQNNLTYLEKDQNKKISNQRTKNAFDDFDQILNSNNKVQDLNTVDKNTKSKDKNQGAKEQNQFDNIQSVDFKNKAKNQQKNKYYKKSDQENQIDELKTKNIQKKAKQSKNTDSPNKINNPQKEENIQEISTKNRNPPKNNKLFKQSDQEIQQVGQVKTKQVIGNKFKRKEKRQGRNQNEKQVEQGDIKENQAKRKQKKIQNKQINENALQEGQTTDFAGQKRKKKIEGNQNNEKESEYLQDGKFRQATGKRNIKDKNNLPGLKNQLEQGNTYDHLGNKVQRKPNQKSQQSINPLSSIDTQKSIIFKKGNNFLNNNDFQQQKYQKRKSSQSKNIISSHDNGLNINQEFQESYDDVVKKNKQKMRVPEKKMEVGTLNINQSDDFQELNYIRPESKVIRPSSRSNKDNGLGINQQNTFSDSEDISKVIRKGRSSARQRINKKSNLNIQDKDNQIQDMQPQDSKRSTIIKKKKQIKSGILQIQDFSQDEHIDSIQL